MNKTDTRYRELLEKHNFGEGGTIEHLFRYLDHFHEMSNAEAECFGVDPSLDHRLWLAYSRYRNMAGITDSGLWREEDAQSDRIHHWRYLQGNDVKYIARFMSEACELPYKDCLGYALFMFVSMYRSMVLYADEMRFD